MSAVPNNDLNTMISANSSSGLPPIGSSLVNRWCFGNGEREVCLLRTQTDDLVFWNPSDREIPLFDIELPPELDPLSIEQKIEIYLLSSEPFLNGAGVCQSRSIPKTWHTWDYENKEIKFLRSGRDLMLNIFDEATKTNFRSPVDFQSEQSLAENLPDLFFERYLVCHSRYLTITGRARAQEPIELLSAFFPFPYLYRRINEWINPSASLTPDERIARWARLKFEPGVTPYATYKWETREELCWTPIYPLRERVELLKCFEIDRIETVRDRFLCTMSLLPRFALSKTSLFTLNDPNPVPIDKDFWAVTLIDTQDESSLLGHACIIIEKIEDGRYIMCKADFRVVSETDRTKKEDILNMLGVTGSPTVFYTERLDYDSRRGNRPPSHSAKSPTYRIEKSLAQKMINRIKWEKSQQGTEERQVHYVLSPGLMPKDRYASRPVASNFRSFRECNEFFRTRIPEEQGLLRLSFSGPDREEIDGVSILAPYDNCLTWALKKLKLAGITPSSRLSFSNPEDITSHGFIRGCQEN